jgi:hypothetical protein
MYMPRSHGYRYIVAARDDLSGVCEVKALKKATAQNLSTFFWEQIYCRYGAPLHVTTDNGPEVMGAFKILVRRLGIPMVQISPYNHHANGVVEQGHFTLREALVKSCGDRIADWPLKLAAASFSDRVTVSRVTGFSPYQLLHATDPVLPFDLTEATFLVDGYRSGMSTAELLALRIRQIERHETDIQKAVETLQKARFRSKEQFERRFKRKLSNIQHKPGALVIVFNSEVEYKLDRKHQDKYLGPYEVIRRTRNGAYLLKELDGAIHQTPYAARRLLPFITRNHWFMRKHDEDNENSEDEEEIEESSTPDSTSTDSSETE